MSEKLDCKLKTSDEWIEIFPYGVVLGVDNSKPVLIFKDEKEKHILPVWLNPTEAHLASTQPMNSLSPHHVTFEFFKKIKWEVSQVFFKSVTGPSQIIEVHFCDQKTNEVKIIEANAEEAMSFCICSQAQFFTNIDNIQQSRDREWEMNKPRMGLSTVGQQVAIHRKGYLN